MRTETPCALLAHPGTQYAPHLARELRSHGLLYRYWTGLALAEYGLAGRLLDVGPPSLRKRLGNRIVPVDSGQLRTLPMLDWLARGPGSGVAEEAALFERNRRFQEAIPDREIRAADVVIGFDTSSWILARRAKAHGKVFILDQSIGHPAAKERVFERVRARYPRWSTSAPSKAVELLQVEREEHSLADMIVVPSRFVQQTLVTEGVPESKIQINPFGTDTALFQPGDNRQRGAQEEPVIFLFVGGITARKGVPVLLEAWRQLALPDAMLWLVGPGRIPNAQACSLPPTVKVWGPKLRHEVATVMQHADVFVFPSFFEGLAQVQIEALASGLPVIGTPESGADSLVTDGRDGLVLPSGDVSALADAIHRLARDHELRRAMQRLAVAKRAQLGWNVYGDRWADLLKRAAVPCW